MAGKNDHFVPTTKMGIEAVERTDRVIYVMGAMAVQFFFRIWHLGVKETIMSSAALCPCFWSINQCKFVFGLRSTDAGRPTAIRHRLKFQT